MTLSWASWKVVWSLRPEARAWPPPPNCSANLATSILPLERLVEPVGVHAGLDQLGGQAVRVRPGVGELEPAGVGDDAEVQRGRDLLVQRHVPPLQQLGDDLGRRGGGGVHELVGGPVFLRE